MYQCRIPHHRHRGGDGGSSDHARDRNLNGLRHRDGGDGDARAHLHRGDGDARAHLRHGDDGARAHLHRGHDARFSRPRLYHMPEPSLLNLLFPQSCKDLC